MAKGTQAKADITAKILEVFPNSFLNDKEIRIPMVEDGADIQIKITLTAAKDLISQEGLSFQESTSTIVETPKTAIVSEEEKQNVYKALASLGL